MQPTRLRLAEFCRVMGEEREAVRARVARGGAPFPTEMPASAPKSKQRTYDAADMTAWCLFSRLMAGGMTANRASDAVLLSQAVPQFFSALGRGEDVSDWHLFCGDLLRRRGHGDDRDNQLGREGEEYRLPFASHGTSQDIGAQLKAETSGYGQQNMKGETRLGLVALTSVPVLPCYHRVERVLEQAGYLLKGRDILDPRSEGE